MREPVDNVKRSGRPAAAGGPGTASLELIHTVMHQVRAQQYQALRDGPHRVTHMDSKVLGFFSRHPGATLSELAAHSGRDKAQLARLVAGLREGGLLQGEPDPADRRNVRLSLTEAGTAVQQALHAQTRRLAAQAVAGFSAAELAQLDALLARLRDNLASADAA